MPEEKTIERIMPITFSTRNLLLRSDALRCMTSIFGAIQNGDIPASEEAKAAALTLLTEFSKSFCDYVKDENNFKKE